MNSSARPAPVVVAVDGTDRSEGAVRYAIHEARRRRTRLTIVHVAPTALPVGGSMPYMDYPRDALVEVAQRILDEAVGSARALDPDLTVDGVLRQGRRVVELAVAAAAGSLLVLGRETRHGLDRVYVGTTTAGVAARAPVPVAVIDGAWQPTQHGRVLVGVEPASSEVLAYAFPLAAARHALLQVMHVWKVPDPYASLDRGRSVTGEWVIAATRLLESTVSDWRASFPDVEVEVSVVPGRAAQVLADAAAGADVLLLARRRRDIEHPGRLGPTTRAVLGHPGAPVEVVPLTGVPQHAPLVLERFGEILKS
ncbi:universal stress protein [Krasilnikoviella flava]|uniref:Nucleotide-binding universal stress protein, UspA family n=1 Tax=Krasilnikoviella flava TaxID=526729 RepID=A0A1T5KYJ2_9MICO|nr:universal stress protein [Krasilnikoviella flava]SKC68892.1 Nucleotide-binding universal stress protein, UspA family [Krasilnikoviella flava]